MSDVSAIRPLIEAIPGNKAWFVAYRKAGKQLLVQQPTLSEAMTALAVLPRDAEVEVRCDMGTDVPENMEAIMIGREASHSARGAAHPSWVCRLRFD